jgi:hypothetical protein
VFPYGALFRLLPHLHLKYFSVARRAPALIIIARDLIKKQQKCRMMWTRPAIYFD